MGLYIALAYLLDLIFGDPQWFPHPVRGIGKLIIFLERGLEGNQSKECQRVKGALLAMIVVGASGFCAYLFIEGMGRINYLFKSIAWIFLAYTTLATGDLFNHGRAVFKKIEQGNIKEAQYKLSHIVGRDTQKLSIEQIIKATIESVAESTNDGIIAPIFYLILGGPVLAIVYKSINTLDSMVGHKNERYLYFGWFSARLDDIVNFIPSRIAGFLILISSFILGKEAKNSFRIMIRDGQKCSSPNSGIPQAAMAGALGVRLGGPRWYQGKFLEYPYIGEEKRDVVPQLIEKSLRISFFASLFMVSFGVLAKWAIWII
ncbi:MAG: adenosylcobinamide-phosphate synthase CbiB [Candidatus Omnitrophica bacterium]|nr:adenosylcobinamide-phosphate synthase CbiB [Candidatus Omnitrophota bacterium]MBU0878599.1 adenosylcobinamide-phosphate synthase CbiB [Candidatus Omnitrophota bacterium]MBU0897389.1 adenosylcobinamide-phosphate synthase CbiB [Candidatus Omnitrophota bacterium]MBU1134331.1 adenosylcobinamide-phosphate synthase CbiB [Candidatus Omnitrophota bacterium]MBU1810692.1 adenosylcobinamide-phosphate synthase CbiB [Candidatus Omnitrophota bacterium]